MGEVFRSKALVCRKSTDFRIMGELRKIIPFEYNVEKIGGVIKGSCMLGIIWCAIGTIGDI